jgi:hypothetical protein
VSPLATNQQRDAERRILRTLGHPHVREARDRARKHLESSFIAQLTQAKERIDHTLDSWVVTLAFQEVNVDPDRPSIIWNTSTSAYSWFGHDVPVSALAGDDPDNIYRHAPIDPSARYLIRGRLHLPGPAQFSFQLVRHSDLIPRGKDNVTLSRLTNHDVKISPDGTFTITVDSEPESGRSNHLYAEPGPLLRLIFRDALSDWNQRPTELKIERIAGNSPGPGRDDDALVSNVVAHLDEWVKGWVGFVELRTAAERTNELAPPFGRAGGWGYLSMQLFNIADDEAIVITMDPGGAEYAGVQVVDVWTIAPDPQKHVSSYTPQQSRPDTTGTFTYVIAARDPGTSNWLDTAGIRQGWLILRWQGLPPTRTDNQGLYRGFTIVNFAELQAVLPSVSRSVTTDERAQERRERFEAWRLRTTTGQ